jgi:hypothetical protein
VIFAPDQNLLVGELGTAFVWLLASIARECGNNEYGRVAEMEQLVLLGADGKTLGKSVTAKKTSVELLQLGGGLVRVEFVFTKI